MKTGPDGPVGSRAGGGPQVGSGRPLPCPIVSDQWWGHFARARGGKAWKASSVTPCLLTPSQSPPSRGRGRHCVCIAGLPGSDAPVRTTDQAHAHPVTDAFPAWKQGQASTPTTGFFMAPAIRSSSALRRAMKNASKLSLRRAATSITWVSRISSRRLPSTGGVSLSPF